MQSKTSPKIVVLDLETSPWTGLCYGSMYEPVVVSIPNYSQILSMAWRVVGEKTTKYIAQNMYPEYIPGQIDDKHLVMEICKVLSDVDYVVGHNLDQFDWKIINERIIFHRLPPIKNIPSIDTKKLIKSVTKLPSNKLQHMTEFLGNGGKLEHNGTSLFIGCMNGDDKSWAINKKYNKQDVDITHADFIELLPYIKLNSSQTAFSDTIQCSNPTCLSYNLIKSKNRKVVGGYRMQFQCNDCGRYTTQKKLVKLLA